MEARVKRTFIDSKQEDKAFQINDTWTGTQARMDEINSKLSGALVPVKTDTKERKLTLETKETPKKAKK